MAPLMAHCSSGICLHQRGSPPALLSLTIFIGVAFLICAIPPSSAQLPTEHQVKAAFLYNFAKFVEWPPEAFPGPTSQFQLCVLGEDPFGSDLKDLVKGKAVNHHPVQVLNPANVEQSKTCHIVFVGTSEKTRSRHIVESLQDKSVLTVGDSKGFAQQGGMINFVLENNRVRFEINVKAAEQAKLKISSKLLNVAKLVIV